MLLHLDRRSSRGDLADDKGGNLGHAGRCLDGRDNLAYGVVPPLRPEGRRGTEHQYAFDYLSGDLFVTCYRPHGTATLATPIRFRLWLGQVRRERSSVPPTVIPTSVGISIAAARRARPKSVSYLGLWWRVRSRLH
jgi:hypothetical protein